MSEDRFNNFPTFSDFFRRFPKTSDLFRRFKKIQKCWKLILSTLRQISEIFRRIRKFPMNSEDFIKEIKNTGRSSWALCDIFRFFPNISEHFQRLPKISEDFQKFRKLVGMFVFALSGAFFKVIQRISKHSTKETRTLTSGSWSTVNFFMYVIDK